MQETQRRNKKKIFFFTFGSGGSLSTTQRRKIRSPIEKLLGEKFILAEIWLNEAVFFILKSSNFEIPNGGGRISIF